MSERSSCLLVVVVAVDDDDVDVVVVVDDDDGDDDDDDDVVAVVVVVVSNLGASTSNEETQQHSVRHSRTGSTFLPQFGAHYLTAAAAEIAVHCKVQLGGGDGARRCLSLYHPLHASQATSCIS